MKNKILSNVVKEPEIRTTCTLSVEGSAAFDSLTKKIGLTQKKVFDLLVTGNGINDDVMSIAIGPNCISSQKLVKKSIVIAKKNLKSLNLTSEKTGIKRDIIIDVGLILLESIFNSAIEAQKMQRIKANQKLNILLDHSYEIENDLKGFLDEDDGILSRLSIVIVHLTNLVSDIENNIESGIQINPEGM